jgi:hypothetical protein
MMPCIGAMLQQLHRDRTPTRWLELMDEDPTVLNVVSNWIKNGRRDISRVRNGDELVGADDSLLCKLCVFGERYCHQDLATQAADRYRVMRQGFFYRWKFWTPDIEHVQYVFSYSTLQSSFRRMLVFNTASKLFYPPRHSLLRNWLRVTRCNEVFSVQVHEAIIYLVTSGADVMLCRGCEEGPCPYHGYVWNHERPRKILFDDSVAGREYLSLEGDGEDWRYTE